MKKLNMFVFTIFTCTLLSGCFQRIAKEGGGLNDYTGKVLAAQDKNKPICLLQTKDERLFQLTGPLAEELKSVPRAEVVIHGKQRESYPYTKVFVCSYTITSIAGKYPFVGFVKDKGNKIILETIDDYKIYDLSVSSPLFSRITSGKKTWVVGSFDDSGKLHVVSFGILKP